MDSIYWITIAIPALDQEEAEQIAKNIAGGHNTVINVDSEPPQGSMIVGNFWETEDVHA